MRACEAGIMAAMACIMWSTLADINMAIYAIPIVKIIPSHGSCLWRPKVSQVSYMNSDVELKHRGFLKVGGLQYLKVSTFG